MTFQTPNKRHWTDMLFSPEQCGDMQNPDQETMKNYLREILDEKFNQHLQPLQNTIEELQKEVINLKKEHAREVKILKEENDRLHKHVKLEGYQMRNNIRFFNVAEENREDLDTKIVQICNKDLPSSCALNSRSLERIRRMGPVIGGRKRTVIAKCLHYKDKVNILKIRQQLKTAENISVSDDFSPEVEKQRNQLYPIMRAIKDNMQSEDKSKVSLRDNQLILRGRAYGITDLHLLPSEFDPHKLFTPTRNNITAFYTRNSMLSNHYACEFKVKGQKFSNMEQYLFCALSDLFGDAETKTLIEQETNPVKIKSLGKKIRNFNLEIWNSRINGVLQKGLLEKFKQNPLLLSELLATGESVIVEANRFDSKYGIGLSLTDTDVWRPEKWRGDNRMGQALMDVRSQLRMK